MKLSWKVYVCIENKRPIKYTILSSHKNIILKGMDIICSGETEIIGYDNRELVTLTFKNNLTSDTIIKYSKLLLEIIGSYKTKKVLVDTSKVTNVRLEDVLWLTESISPIIRKHSIEKIAFVNPQTILVTVSLNLMIKLSKSNVTMIFNELEEAKSWIFNTNHKSA